MKRNETNKIIAEFMGAYQDDRGYWGFTNTKECHRWHTDRFLDATHYDTDWNWLMEVVEKIESLEKRKYTLITQQNSCLLWDNNKGEELEYFNNSFKAQTKIEAVYNACVEFIKWYNENGAKNN